MSWTIRDFVLRWIFLLVGMACASAQAALPTCNAAAEGKIAYDSSAKTLNLCNGTSWLPVSTGSGSGFSLSCSEYSANQAKLISSSSSYWAPFCLIGQSTSFQNPNWQGHTAANLNSARTTCAGLGAEICSVAQLKRVYASTGGSTGLNGLQLWTRDQAHIAQYQNGTTCQGGSTCYPQEWQPYVFQNNATTNAHVDLAQQQYGFFCCRQ